MTRCGDTPGDNPKNTPEDNPEATQEDTPQLSPRRLAAMRAGLADLDAPGLVREITRLPGDHRAVAFRLLPKDRALAVFEDLDPSVAADLLRRLRSDVGDALVRDLDPDDRARLFDELPASVTARLLRGLDPNERRMTEELLGYPPESAGRRMSPEVASVPLEATVGAAIRQLRALGGEAETIYMVPVLGPGRRLEGVVSLRCLLTAAPSERLADIASPPIAAGTHEDQEAVARRVRDHGTIGLPVVDAERRLVGVFTVDDAMRVLAEEDSEDAARAGGTEPLRRPYLATPVLRIVRSRIVWLLVLIAAATLTVNVLDHFEETLERVVALALFIPMLIGTGGNTGAQTVTTVVRAMSVDDVGLRDLPRVLAKELATGLLVGTGLALLAGALAGLVVDPAVGLVLGLSLIAVCTLAAGAGSLIPMLAKRVGVDPAVVSAPLITTLVDASGLIIYFLVARAVLGL